MYKLGVLAFSAVLLLAAAESQATELALFETTTVNADAPGAAGRHVVRERLVFVDPEAIASQVLPPDSKGKANREAISAALRGEISIALFGDVTVHVKLREVEALLDSGVIWTGDVADGNGYAILVADGARIVGVIQNNLRNYRIEPAGPDGLHRVVEFDAGAFPADEVVVPPGAARFATDDAEAPAGAEPRAITRIKVLAAYTQRSLAHLGATPAQAIAADLAIANLGMANSGISARFKLVGTKAVSSSFNEQALGNPSSDTFRALKKVTSGKTDNFRAIRRKRNSLKADLVTLYAATDPGGATQTCGQAWLFQNRAIPEFGFSTVNSFCVGTVTLAHELGHNLGGDHDRFVLLPQTFSNNLFRFGFVSLAGGFFDIMGYPNQCAANAVSCSPIPYFSTPNRTFNGFPIGIAKGLSGAADSTRKIKSVFKTVAGYR